MDSWTNCWWDFLLLNPNQQNLHAVNPLFSLLFLNFWWVYFVTRLSSDASWWMGCESKPTWTFLTFFSICLFILKFRCPFPHSSPSSPFAFFPPRILMLCILAHAPTEKWFWSLCSGFPTLYHTRSQQQIWVDCIQRLPFSYPYIENDEIFTYTFYISHPFILYSFTEKNESIFRKN